MLFIETEDLQARSYYHSPAIQSCDIVWGGVAVVLGAPNVSPVPPTFSLYFLSLR